MKILVCLLLCPCVVAAALAQTPRVTAPNGGERLSAGGSFTIRWSGTLPADAIALDYTTDNGTNWNPITAAATGFSYPWNPVPNTPSAQCRVRITVQRAAGNADTVLQFQPADPQKQFSGRRAEFDPTGAWVLTADEGGWVRVYNSVTTALRWESRVCLPQFAGDPSFVMNARFSPDGATVAAYTARDSVILLDAVTGAEIRRWHNGKTSFPSAITDRTCAFSPDGTMLAVSTYQSVRLYNPATGAMIREMTQFVDGGVNVVEWTANSARYLAGMASGRVYVVDAVTGATAQSFMTLTTVETAAFSPDGSKVVTASRSRAFVQMWDVASGGMDFQTATSNISGFDYPSVQFARDGLSVYTSGEGFGGSVWAIRRRSVTDGSLLGTVRYARTLLGGLSINPTSARFCCVSGYGAVVLQPPTGGTQTLVDQSDAPFTIADDQKDTAQIYIPPMRVQAGTVVQVPVKIRGALGVRATSLTVNLRVRADILDPVSPPPGTTVSGQTRTLPLSLPPVAAPDSVLLLIPFRVMLSADSLTVMDLDDTVGVLGGPAVVTGIDGLLTVDICRQGNPRLVDGSRVLKLRVQGSNTVSSDATSADIELIEPGATSLTLVDMYGRTTPVWPAGWLNPGTYQAHIPLNACASGTYTLVLRTPTQLCTERIMVAR